MTWKEIVECAKDFVEEKTGVRPKSLRDTQWDIPPGINTLRVNTCPLALAFKRCGATQAYVYSHRTVIHMKDDVVLSFDNPTCVTEFINRVDLKRSYKLDKHT